MSGFLDKEYFSFPFSSPKMEETLLVYVDDGRRTCHQLKLSDQNDDKDCVYKQLLLSKLRNQNGEEHHAPLYLLICEPSQRG